MLAKFQQAMALGFGLTTSVMIADGFAYTASGTLTFVVLLLCSCVALSIER